LLARPEANLFASIGRSREFSDIVKRRSLRVAGETEVSCATQSPASWRVSFARPQGRAARRRQMLVVPLLDRRERRTDLEASWSF
jgi:hypothetical protein